MVRMAIVATDDKTTNTVPPGAADVSVAPVAAQAVKDPIVRVQDLRLFYGKSEALHGITMDFPRFQATALIGPSGCGKSTLLRCLDRMNDLIEDVHTTGAILLEGQDITDPTLDVIELRRRV